MDKPTRQTRLGFHTLAHRVRGGLPIPSARVRAVGIPPRSLSQGARVALIVLIGIAMARATPPLEGWHVVGVALAAVIFGAAFPLAALCRLPVWIDASCIGLAGLAGALMQALHVVGFGLLMSILALSQASRLRSPHGPLLALVIGGSYEAAAIASSGAINPGDLLATTAGLLFAYLAAAYFHRLREEKAKTEILLSEVLAGRDAQIRAAALDERARIAREIHDILAHTLSALAVQLEGTRLLIEQRPDDPAAPAALERASHLVRDGLEETRQAVGALRGDALPGPETLPRLIADFERDSGIHCRLSLEGTPVALTSEARLALYRTAQEALTNVRKHAAATSACVRLRYTECGAELTVENDGCSAPARSAGGGHGLAGMRERAELARGRLQAGPTPTGFRVQLWLPA